MRTGLVPVTLHVEMLKYVQERGSLRALSSNFHCNLSSEYKFFVDFSGFVSQLLDSESPKQKIVRYEIMASTVDVILPLAHEFRLRPDHCYLKHQ